MRSQAVLGLPSGLIACLGLTISFLAMMACRARLSFTLSRAITQIGLGYAWSDKDVGISQICLHTDLRYESQYPAGKQAQVAM